MFQSLFFVIKNIIHIFLFQNFGDRETEKYMLTIESRCIPVGIGGVLVLRMMPNYKRINKKLLICLQSVSVHLFFLHLKSLVFSSRCLFWVGWIFNKTWRSFFSYCEIYCHFLTHKQIFFSFSLYFLVSLRRDYKWGISLD